jgi:hypothetical protein
MHVPVSLLVQSSCLKVFKPQPCLPVLLEQLLIDLKIAIWELLIQAAVLLQVIVRTKKQLDLRDGVSDSLKIGTI